MVADVGPLARCEVQRRGGAEVAGVRVRSGFEQRAHQFRALGREHRRVERRPAENGPGADVRAALHEGADNGGDIPFPADHVQGRHLASSAPARVGARLQEHPDRRCVSVLRGDMECGEAGFTRCDLKIGSRIEKRYHHSGVRTRGDRDVERCQTGLVGEAGIRSGCQEGGDFFRVGGRVHGGEERG